MKNVLLFGAGKSATVLIDYLIKQTETQNWFVTVADADLILALQKVGTAANATAVSFDVLNDAERNKYITQADIVISLLPPALHIMVAKDCLQLKKNLLTASYTDDAVKALKTDIEKNNLIFLYEMGLDPGIDHMSAMRIIDDIHERDGSIISFKSHCGGLIAPESDDNPWHYKISWNPKNIVLAGKAGAFYKENGIEYKQHYEELFNPGRLVEMPGLGFWGWYPNRDSLSYTSLYNLENTQTFIRTTLRHPEFISGWKNIIELKLTDETPQYDTNGKTLKKLFKEHWDRYKIEKELSDIAIRQLLFLGMNDGDTIVSRGLCSAADILQFAFERKLQLHPEDKDMIVMLHEIEYKLSGHKNIIKSCLVVKGENSVRTAMAKTVGLPLGIAANLILNNKIKQRGLQIPIKKEFYIPVLEELKRNGVVFHETITEI
ncbi:MAG: saccharopine dehydrogenase NADP-binding domain-containing protein [Chitinophagaceae bacterium]|nr:saccharopine dehydrogenase NADP-binding domain-containing protein [Chitinophagaceae bacterium]